MVVDGLSFTSDSPDVNATAMPIASQGWPSSTQSKQSAKLRQYTYLPPTINKSYIEIVPLVLLPREVLQVIVIHPFTYLGDRDPFIHAVVSHCKTVHPAAVNCRAADVTACTAAALVQS